MASFLANAIAALVVLLLACALPGQAVVGEPQIFRQVRVAVRAADVGAMPHACGARVLAPADTDAYRRGGAAALEDDEIIVEFVAEGDEPLPGRLLDVVHEDVTAFYQSRLTSGDEARRRQTMSDEALRFASGSMGGYLTLGQMNRRLVDLVTAHPDQWSLHYIGQSVEGRILTVYEWGDGPEEDSILYTALHHAREPMSMMSMLYFMEYLSEGLDRESTVNQLHATRRLWFLPALNPDGYYYNEQLAPQGGGMHRKNRGQFCVADGLSTSQGVDLNRNYGYEWGRNSLGSSGSTCQETYRGPNPFSEPETTALRDFVLARSPRIALNYHSFGNLLLLPFGFEAGATPPEADRVQFEHMGRLLTAGNGYRSGYGWDILYVTNGDSDDWMYGEAGVFAFTPEVGGERDGFWPATERILPLAEENLAPNVLAAQLAGFWPTASVAWSQQGEDFFAAVTFRNSGLGTASSVIASWATLNATVLALTEAATEAEATRVRDVSKSSIVLSLGTMTRGQVLAEHRFAMRLRNPLDLSSSLSVLTFSLTFSAAGRSYRFTPVFTGFLCPFACSTTNMACNNARGVCECVNGFVSDGTACVEIQPPVKRSWVGPQPRFAQEIHPTAAALLAVLSAFLTLFLLGFARWHSRHHMAMVCPPSKATVAP